MRYVVVCIHIRDTLEMDNHTGRSLPELRSASAHMQRVGAAAHAEQSPRVGVKLQFTRSLAAHSGKQYNNTIITCRGVRTETTKRKHDVKGAVNGKARQRSLVGVCRYAANERIK
jgi:hypothetical protein